MAQVFSMTCRYRLPELPGQSPKFFTHVQDRRDARGADGLDAAGRPGQVAVPIACEHDLDHDGDRSGPSSGAANRFRPASTWGALGTHNNEKRRLTLEDAGRRFRRSAAVFGNY